MNGPEYDRGLPSQSGKPDNQDELRLPPKPSQFFLLLSLFVRPSLALLIAQLHRMWVFPLFLTLAFVTVAAMFSSWSFFGKCYPVVKSIITAIADDVTPITLNDGKFGWRDEDAPYTRIISGWQIDFSAVCDETKFSESEARHGVCVTPKSVDIWSKDFLEQGKYRIEHVWKERQIKKFSETLAKNGESGFDRESFVAVGKMCCLLALPVLVLGMFLRYFWVILLCQLIFCVTTAFLRRGGAYALVDLVVIGINLSVVPTLVSLVWNAAAPSSWGFDNIYFVAFVIYLLYAFHDAKTGNAPVRDNEGDEL
ncbi:MAG: hypothetical protein IJS15_14530 [Victivallales bacterium]|nr:hypothetical protein [Victivallales bacterium]